MEYLAGRLDLQELADEYARNADDLKAAVQEHCWDERDGFFYSVDLNLRPVSTEKEPYHGGAPRTWDCLIQRIGVWSGFLAMWADIATPEQAERMVREHFSDERTFNAPYGVRTLSKMEKMYSLKASGNPSTWLGPIWGVSNYLTWRGLVKYGFKEEAQEPGIEDHRPVRAGLRTHGRAARILPALERRTDPQSGLPELEYAGHQHAQLDGRQTGRGGVLIHRTARTAAHRALHTARRAFRNTYPVPLSIRNHFPFRHRPGRKMTLHREFCQKLKSFCQITQQPGFRLCLILFRTRSKNQ